MHEVSFTVIDLETTGLQPLEGDRIVEIAMIRITPERKISSEFCSLIHPQRKMAATNIHGITAGDVAEAPTFGALAGSIARFLAGTLPVAHNAAFERKFLYQEFERLQVTLPDSPWICTRELSKQLCPFIHRYSLANCCRYFNIPQDLQHSALEDAKATGRLLLRLLEVYYQEHHGDLIDSKLQFSLLPSKDAWPQLEDKATPKKRRST